MTRILLFSGPIAAALVMAFVIVFFMDSFVRDFPPELMRFTPVLKIFFPVFCLMIFLRSLLNEKEFRDVAMGSALGVLLIIGWVAFDEYQRLAPYARKGYSWADLSAYFDGYALCAALLATPMAIWFAQMGRNVKGRTRSGKKRVTRSKNTTYGEADWMSEDDASALFPEGPGIVIGENYRPDLDLNAGPTFDPDEKATWGEGGKHKKLCYNGQFGPTHGVVFAGSGGFKTTGIVVPSALNWRGSMVVLDPSREVLPMVVDQREAMKQKIRVIDPDKPEFGFNVLDWINAADDPAQSVAATAAWLMKESPSVSTGSDEFFREQSLSLITALLGDIMLSGQTDAKDQNLIYLRDMIAQPESDLKDHLERIYKNSESKFVRQLAGTFVQMVQATFSGIYANANKETRWLSFERFGKIVSGDSFNTADLRNGKTDVFINLDLKTLKDHPALGRVIIGALLNSLYEADGNVAERTLFLLDEANLVGRMAIIEKARDAGRKYKITLLMIYQSIGQLIDTWGPQAKMNWFESTAFRVFAAIADLKTAEELSAMCGEFTAQTMTRTKSNIMSKRASNSRNYSDQKRRLILPHEILQEMRTDEQLVFVTAQPPIRCGRAIYFRRPDMLSKVGENRFAKRAS